MRKTSSTYRYTASFGARYHTGARAGDTVVFCGGFHTDVNTGDPIDENCLVRSAAGRWSSRPFGQAGFDATKTPWHMV